MRRVPNRDIIQLVKITREREANEKMFKKKYKKKLKRESEANDQLCGKCCYEQYILLIILTMSRLDLIV